MRPGAARAACAASPCERLPCRDLMGSVTRPDQTHAAVEAVVRMESARLIAGLARYTGDVGLAEELAQDARGGRAGAVARARGAAQPGRLADDGRQAPGHRPVPPQPGAASAGTPRSAGTLRGRGARSTPSWSAAIADDIDDDLLRLVFVACHPVLSVPARVALTLRLLGGLTTVEIARAYLVPEADHRAADRPGQEDAGQGRRCRSRCRHRRERAARLASVLEVIYLIFNEGYSATAGDDWMRPALCADALRLGRVLAELMPDEPEVHGLVALMEIQASRAAARVGPTGEPVLLLDQDRARWDRLLINRGLAALARAEELGGAAGRTRCRRRSRPATPGRSARGHRLGADRRALRRAGRGDAVAGRRAEPGGRGVDGRGPAGRARPGRRAGRRPLRGYHLLPSVRGDLLVKLGRPAEAAPSSSGRPPDQQRGNGSCPPGGPGKRASRPAPRAARDGKRYRALPSRLAARAPGTVCQEEL